MSGDSSSNSDWAVVTQEGELESDEDASCSGSSIELLSSDDDSVSQVNRSSATGSSQSGPFFVLRLRPKAELLTESDSDDKEVPARKIKQKTIQSPKNTDAEKIVMKDDKECELECDKNETKNETKKVVETAEKDISLKAQETSDADTVELSMGNNYGDSVDSVTSTNISEESQGFNDDISFPSSSEEFSDESVPEILHLLEDISGERSNDISLTKLEEKADQQTVTPVVQEESNEATEETLDHDSLKGSSFSFLGEECNQTDGQERGDNKEEENISSASIGQDNQEYAQNPDNEDNLRRRIHSNDQNEDQAGDIGHPPQVMVRQNRRRNKCKISPCILLVVEMLTILVVGFSAYLVGLYQGSHSQVSMCCPDLDRSLKNFSEVNKYMDQIRASIRTHSDEVLFNSLLSTFHPISEEEIHSRDNECISDLNEGRIFLHQPSDLLQKDINWYLCIVRQRIEVVAEKKDIERKTMKYEFLVEMNKLKNENADLQREIEEHGKRKYLVKELEDENIALFKRISDLESQLMETEGQVYILQLKLSKCEKKEASTQNDALQTQLNNNIAKLEEEKKMLKSKITELENEKLKLKEDLKQSITAEKAIVDHVHFSDKLKDSQNKLDMLEIKYNKLEKSCSDSQTWSNGYSSYHANSDQSEDSEDETIQVDDVDYDDHDDGYTESKSHETLKEDLEKEKLKSTDYSNEPNGKNQKKGGNRRQKEKDGGRKDHHRSWSDAFSDILNRTKISMVNVNQQIQETLSQVKNISEELWKKHEPQVNDMLTTAYYKMKKNVHNVAKKVSHVAQTLVKKSAKFIEKYRRKRKNKRHNRKHNPNQDWEDSSYNAQTSRRGSKQYRKKHKSQWKNDDESFSYENDKSYHDEFQGRNTHDSFLESELQDLHDSVEYTNMLRDLDCSNILDIMEDFQHFQKIEGTAILSKKEKSWFYCQKSWFEGMAYSDPQSDIKCRNEMGKRQLAASDHGCCPCFGKYGRSQGKFCHLNGGCSALKPKEKNWSSQKREEKKTTENKMNKNETLEEEVAMNHGKYIYCDPFSQDLDCGDESWYLKRMKDREHLRNYRTSSKTDWLFQRAEERDFYRTQPDNWYFNKMSGGQAYEAYQDEMPQKKEQTYP